jgi:hypothetical protein
MSKNLPIELENRCERILRVEAQGIPLTKVDYLWFVLATVIIPAVLIIFGASL